MGKSTINGSFSIAMLNYQRVIVASLFWLFDLLCPSNHFWAGSWKRFVDVQLDWFNLTHVKGMSIKNWWLVVHIHQSWVKSPICHISCWFKSPCLVKSPSFCTIFPLEPATRWRLSSPLLTSQWMLVFLFKMAMYWGYIPHFQTQKPYQIGYISHENIYICICMYVYIYI